MMSEKNAVTISSERPYLDLKRLCGKSTPYQYSNDVNEDMIRKGKSLFKCIECIKYEPETGDICHCGEKEMYHSVFPYKAELTGNNEWSTDYLEQVPRTNSVGKVIFPIVDSEDNIAFYARVSHEDNLQRIIEFTTDYWKLLSPRRPKLCISLLTAEYKDKISADRKKKLVQEFLDCLQACNILLLNNGLKISFNYLIGEALASISTNQFGEDVKFSYPKSIGVVPWGGVLGRSKLINSHTNLKTIEYNPSDSIVSSRFTRLLPYNSSHLLVDDGFRGDKAVRSLARNGFRARFENKITSAKNASGLSVPVVDVMIGGDFNVLLEAQQAIKAKIQLLICKGSSGMADVIAMAYEFMKRNDTSVWNKVSKFEKTTIKVRVYKVIGQVDATEALEILEEIMNKIDQITIYDLDGEKVLRRTLMSSIVNNTPDVLGKLYLSLSWHNHFIAETVAEKKLNDIFPAQLYGLMQTALLNNELEFVKLFIRLGVDIWQFLTVDVLHSLYNFSSDRAVFLNNLRNGHCDQLYAHYPPPTSEQLSLTEGGRKHMSSENGLQIAFETFLNHMEDKTVSSYMDALKEEEEIRLMKGDVSTTYLAAVMTLISDNFNCTLYKCDTPDNFYRSNMVHCKLREPADHLAIWAILHARPKMALYFLTLSTHPVHLSIFGAALYRQMSADVPNYDTTTLQLYKEYANQFEAVGVDILNMCEERDSHMAMAMLLKYKPYWAVHLATVSAANSNCLKIVSSNTFQKVVDEAWNDGIKASFFKVFLTCLCPLFVFLPNFTMNLKLNEQIEELKHRIPYVLQSDNTEGVHDEKLDEEDDEEEEEEGDEEDDEEEDLETQNPMQWRKMSIFFTSPMTKFSYNLLSLLIYTIIFSYYLLFAMNDKTFSVWEIVVVIYSIGLFIENVSMCVREDVNSIQSFFSLLKTYPWLPIYFTADICFFIALVSRFVTISNVTTIDSHIVGVRMYSLQLIFNNVKFLYLMMLSQYYGPKVVMIKEMLKELTTAALILFIIMTAYGATIQVLLYPTIDDFSVQLLVGIFFYPYFQLFGEMSFDFFNPPEVDSNNPNSTSQIQPNPVAPFLHALYMLVAVLIFLNLLIAIFSKVFSNLKELSNEIWKQNRFRVIFYFRRISVVPMPFSPIYMFIMQCVSMVKKKYAKKADKKHEKKKNSANEDDEDENLVEMFLLNETWFNPVIQEPTEESVFSAYLHRFQHFCAIEHNDVVEQSDEDSFYEKLGSIKQRMDKLHERQLNFSERLPDSLKINTRAKTATSKTALATQSRSVRMNNLENALKEAEQKYAEIKNKC